MSSMNPLQSKVGRDEEGTQGVGLEYQDTGHVTYPRDVWTVRLRRFYFDDGRSSLTREEKDMV